VQIELNGRGFDCNSSSGLRVLGLIPGALHGVLQDIRHPYGQLHAWEQRLPLLVLSASSIRCSAFQHAQHKCAC
jgi:hypothetical protein